MSKTKRTVLFLALFVLVLIGRSLSNQPITRNSQLITQNPQLATHYSQLNIFQSKSPTSDDLSQRSRSQIGHGIYLANQELLLTNKHILSDTEQSYAIDPKDLTKEITNIRLHPTLDLAIAKTLSSPEQIQPVTFAENWPGMIYYLDKSKKIFCQIDGQQDGLLTSSECQFQAGQSGSPVYNEHHHFVGLITATNNQGGYILPIDKNELNERITTLEN